MKNKKHIDLITAYMDGSITPEQRAELNRLIETGEIDALELKEMDALYQKMDKLPVPEPGENVRNRFYTMLEEEKRQQSSSFSHHLTSWVRNFQLHFTGWQAAVAVGFFLMGLLVGNWTTPFQNYKGELSALSTEVSQMREVMMMSLLDNNSATERLKAINISSEIELVDERIATALLKTLNNDSNVNVRLAAVEALLQHASAPFVRQGLVASIQKQTSPLVQSALADAMLILQEEQSADEFKKLLDQNELDPGVRGKLENTIAALS